MVRLLNRRNGEAFDLSRPLAPTRTFAVASVPRSGSTMLCRVLWDTGGAGAPDEYLNPSQIRDWEVRLGTSASSRLGYGLLRGRAVSLAGGRWWGRERLEAHVARVRERRTDPNGLFGLKIHHHHLEGWFLDRGWPVEKILAPERWVRLVREDRLAQAVSWVRALQTWTWVAHRRGYGPSIYSSRQIRGRLAEIERQEAGWDAFFADRGVEPLQLTYEELVADVPGVVRRILGYLGVPGALSARVAAPDLTRQADEVNARWIERYRAESTARAGAAGVAPSSRP